MSSKSLHATPTSHHRFHALDALRGIAAIMVVLCHMPDWMVSHFTKHNAPLAVDFFFCLSGFVIAFSYERRLQNKLSMRDFLRARFIRLYPVYLIGMLWGFLLALLFAINQHEFSSALITVKLLGKSLLMVPDLHHSYSAYSFPLNDPARSLFFEAVANICFAFLIKRKLASNWLLASISLASFGLLIWWVMLGRPVWEVGWGSGMRSFLFGFARIGVSFSLGILVLRLYRREHHKNWPMTIRRSLSWIVVVLLLFVLAVPGRFVDSEPFSLLAICFILPSIVYLGALSSASPNMIKVCTVLGDISYPIYLIHKPFMRLFTLGFAVRLLFRFPLRETAGSLLSLSLFCVFAYLLSQKIDAPVRKHLTLFFKVSPES